MKHNKLFIIFLYLVCFLVNDDAFGQDKKSDSAWKHAHKNIIRYNLSSALLFGMDKTIILGYERVLKPNQSISINAGSVVLPKIASVSTDSFSLGKDLKNKGYNISLDYRFYLGKLNKYNAPRGVYIGPWYSFNRFMRDSNWEFINNGNQRNTTTNTEFNIHSFGVQMGYQFIFWNRLALDLVMIGPGMGFYNVSAKFDSNLTPGEEEQLRQVLTDVISNRFPGLNYVLDGKRLDGNGNLGVTSVGFRYIIHIGFNF
ncbi:MAG: hypothetical protein ACRC2O_06735 [Chitinophagaceae bacterium]